ncbi:hypothetical protein B0J11DRAFT_566774 [Dendryphion nanum]|uniref:Uncharacterized protein n=1 Tax=Dendryphion nanum TaxID=256645 RepID=A0A9P9IQ06_9PLEO|nr:hypothetical protein B0J11DRAFT_566774 [Dendryphion nanum]
MHHLLPFFLLLAPILSSPLPTDPISTILGSKNTLYLVTCSTRNTPTPNCPIPILCPSSTLQKRQQVRTFTALSYYTNGPISSPSSQMPSSFTIITDPAESWEGRQRSAKIGLGDGAKKASFKANIARDAGELAKGGLAGEASVDEEGFVCFKDGETEVGGGGGRGGAAEVQCIADYWCGSIDV